MNDEIKLIAYHEAAHAVLDTVFGFGVEYVTIVPNDEESGSCKAIRTPRYYTYEQMYEELLDDRISDEDLRSLGYDPDTFPNGFEGFTDEGKKCVWCLFAGYIAQEKITGVEYSVDVTGWDGHDYRKIGNLTRLLDGYGSEQRNVILSNEYENARKVVNDHWNKIEAVAKVLLDKQTLTGDEVRQITEGT